MKTVNETFDSSKLEKMEIELDNLEGVTGGNQMPIDETGCKPPERSNSAIGSSEEMFDFPKLHIRTT